MTNNKQLLFSTGEGEPGKAPRALRILVADDDHDAALTLVAILRDEGYQARAVNAGRKVMAAVTELEPDAIILDINMPDMSGWQVASTIRARGSRKEPLIIGISGVFTKGPDRILAELNGFDHYLLKPYALTELLGLLDPLKTEPDK